ncbi:flagellar protein FlaG [Carnobacterium sp. ISL-102]|uniref:flagellar protein FlaG n=1 Tax=Carnobacterium sp. ISL-102 TaxID=2819142 RepID=UPI002035A36D|nr:flagellar protein FlaG [Carnobacterium sp. ISL-102]
MDIIQAVTKSLQIRPIESNTNRQSNVQKYETIENISKSEAENIAGITEISHEELEKSIEKANQYLLGLNIQFDFKFHKGTGRAVVRLVDKQTAEVVKEIPPERMLDVIAGIWDMAGIVVDRKE